MITAVTLAPTLYRHEEGASSASNACRFARGDGLIGNTRAHDAVSTSGIMWPPPSYVPFLVATGTPPHEIDLRETASDDESEHILELANLRRPSTPTHFSFTPIRAEDVHSAR